MRLRAFFDTKYGRGSYGDDDFIPRFPCVPDAWIFRDGRLVCFEVERSARMDQRRLWPYHDWWEQVDFHDVFRMHLLVVSYRGFSVHDFGVGGTYGDEHEQWELDRPILGDIGDVLTPEDVYGNFLILRPQSSSLYA